MTERPKDKEDKIAEFWKQSRIYEKAKLNRKKVKKFYFLDGPPYATGSVHVGIAMNKVLKDFWIRFFRMQGFNVWDQPGYDTHGVPIENQVEKLLGFKSKGDIEKFGVETFIKKCKEFATRFMDVMADQFKNLGVWMNWDVPYMTLTNDYIEGTWYTFKKAFEKGFLYKGKYPVHVCPHCETAVAYNEIEYETVTDVSVYAKFKIIGSKNEFFVIWTTTPWSIPATIGIMVNPKYDYVKIKVDNEYWILAEGRLRVVMEKLKKDYKIVEKFKGDKLYDMKFKNPLAIPLQKNRKGKIVTTEQFVTLDVGTGCVTCAPGHGPEDFKVGKQHGLEPLSPLTLDGKFTEEAGRYSGMFAKDADKAIIHDLEESGNLLLKEPISHEYPFCWRCNSPLLLISVPQWFFKVTEIRENLIKENEKINWVPEWAGYRFKNWIESLGDWPISRQRYWGIPLPIWVCENEKCGKIKVIGSRKELPKIPKDFHKPYIDRIAFKCKCGGKMKRVPDVLDVWFDSGVCAWASLGYPNNKKLFEKLWPVDFVLEGPDQIRGWWNSMMITNIMTFGRRPFDNVLFHGFVLDAHGAKMSKSRGNIVTTEEAIEKYGRDVLRFYYLARPVWEDMYFKLSDLGELAKSFIVVRNTFNFVKTYVPKIPKTKPKNLKKEDKWLLSRLNTVVSNSTDHCRNFISHKAANEILDFVLNDFSRWYIKLVRDRVWPEYKKKDKEAAFYTLFTATETLAKLLAPFCPYLAEAVYQEIIKPLKAPKKIKESVHIEDWPKADKAIINEKLEKEMNIVKQLVELSYAARHKAGIKLRWPVNSVVIVAKAAKKKDVVSATKNLKDVLLRMCNTKNIKAAKPPTNKEDFVKTESAMADVFVEKKMDERLINQALFRELVREIQNMRKKNKFQVTDRILLTLLSDKNTNKFLGRKKKELMKEVGAAKLTIGKPAGRCKGKLKFKNTEIEIAFEKK